MNELDQILRENGETLQYVVFFGLLAVLIVLETVMERSPKPPSRSRRWPANVGLTVLNIVMIGALPVSGVTFADWTADAGIGLLNYISVGAPIAILVGILARSFTSWATHLAMHKIPFLWRFHRVHHTDTFLDISTTVRFHPVELLINIPIAFAAIASLGISPVTLMIYELLDAGMNVLTHANIRIPRSLDRVLRILFVTPDMHRLHHSSYHRETDSNYGATLSIWDHVFRTHSYKEPEALAEMELGLREVQDARANSLGWLLKLPFTPIRVARLVPRGQNKRAERN